MRRSLVHLALAALVSSPLGCDEPSDGDAEPDADADEELDGGADGDGETEPDADLEPASLTVLVRTYATMADAPAPAVGATVALAGPGGSRREAATDAEGRVTFEEVDWASGETAAVSAHLAGHVVESWAELSREAAEALSAAAGGIELLLPAQAGAAAPVTVSGGVAGMVAASNPVSVSPTVPGRRFRSAGPDYEVGVSAGEAFDLVAFEFGPPSSSTVGPRGLEQAVHGWAVVSSPALSTDARVDLELAEPGASEPFAGAFRFPATVRVGFFFQCWGFVQVSSIDSAMTLISGWPTRIDVSLGGGTFDFEGELVRLGSVAAPVTVFALSAEGAGSRVVVDGYPPEGSVDLAFPEPITVTYPEGTAAHPIADRIAWRMSEADQADPTLRVRVQLERVVDDALVHEVWLPPGTLAATLPAPPSSTEPGALYGSSLEANVQHCETDPAAPGLCRRWSSGRWFRIRP